jgi:beta-lactamase regulating signal transducer with metallopeptidase domain
MTESISTQWNAWADTWSGWVVSSFLGTAVVLAVVSLLWLAVRRKAAPQLGYCLFLLVPLKLLVPFEIGAPGWLARWTPQHAIHQAVGRGALSTNTGGSQRMVGTTIEPTAGDSTASAVSETIGVPIHAGNLAADNPKSSVAAVADTTSLVEPSVAAVSAASRPFVSLTKTALLMLAWVSIVAVLTARLIRSQLRLRARIRTASLPPQGLIDSINRLCGRIGVRPIRVLILNDLASPAVCGIVRPVVLVPGEMLDTLTPSQLEWVLLHELAHIRRRDLAVSAFQRLATIVEFWNPAIWIANRVVNRLREYACDDFAAALATGSRVDSSEAFLGVIRLAAAAPSRLKLSGALGLFEAEGKASCFARMSRLLDTERRLKVKLGLASIALLLITGAVSLPQIRAANVDENNAKPAESQKTDAPPAVVSSLRFQLTVVDSQKRPVPKASVEVQVYPRSLLSECKVLSGERDRAMDSSIVARTSTEGLLEIEFAPGEAAYLSCNIITHGYAPFFTAWQPGEKSEAIPQAFTARIEPGQSVGGVIVNEDGQPISGVKVHPWIKYTNSEVGSDSMHIGHTLTTDAEGRWVFHSVPAVMSELGLKLTHPEYVPTDRKVSTETYRVARDSIPDKPIVLPRGLTVTGKVTDRTGTPIVGALVRGAFNGETRDARTGPDGVYRLGGCGPQRTALVVTAKGFGPDLKEVRIDPELAPVDFRLAPGKTLRVRVKDAQGQPIKARIFFRSWRSDQYGHGLDKQMVFTDESGFWEWTDAPEDSIVVDICPRPGMQMTFQTLTARDEEYAFTSTPGLHISGRVTDMETKELVGKLRVMTGQRTDRGIYWDRNNAFAAANGEFEFKTYVPTTVAHVVRIEADGYLPADSRDIRNDEGEVTLDFALKRASNRSGLVILPNGKPAAGAKIAWGTVGSYVGLKNGVLEGGARLEADEQGRFDLPPQPEPYVLVVEHPAGYLWSTFDAGASLQPVELTKWARVEGVYRVGTEPVADAPITLSVSREAYRSSASFETTSRGDGSFVFERVIPGEGRLQRQINMIGDDSSKPPASTSWASINIGSGETTHADIGGTGRPVTGRFVAPDGITDEVDWTYCRVQLKASVPEIPDPPVPAEVQINEALYKQWMKTWEATPEGQAWRRLMDSTHDRRMFSTQYYANVSRDGTFRIEDVSAEDYALNLELEAVNPRRTVESRSIGIVRHRFIVPEIPDGRSNEPLDLGTLKLQKPETRK